MIYAKYTEVLKNLMDNEQTKKALDKAMSTYPLYEQKEQSVSGLSYIPTREELNKKILNNYKYREIGFETVGRFLDELEIALCEIMPYYNQMFQTVETMNVIEDIFGNIDITETYEETQESSAESSGQSQSTNEDSSKSTNKSNSKNTNESSDTTESSSTTSNDDKKVHSDTPQGQLNITAKNIENIPYADSVEWNKSNSNNNGSSSHSTLGESSEDTSGESSTESSGTAVTSGTNESSGLVKTKHTLHKKGNQGVNTYAHDMTEFRGTILNIEQQLINDERLSELFMRVF